MWGSYSVGELEDEYFDDEAEGDLVQEWAGDATDEDWEEAHVEDTGLDVDQTPRRETACNSPASADTLGLCLHALSSRPGGSIFCLVTHLHFYEVSFKEGCCGALQAACASAPLLQVLEFHDCSIAEGLLQHRTFEKLQALGLWGCEGEGHVWKWLPFLQNLKELYLWLGSDSDVQEVEARALVRYVPQLEVLSVDGCNVSQEATIYLAAGLPKLVRVAIQHLSPFPLNLRDIPCTWKSLRCSGAVTMRDLGLLPLGSITDCLEVSRVFMDRGITQIEVERGLENLLRCPAVQHQHYLFPPGCGIFILMVDGDISPQLLRCLAPLGEVVKDLGVNPGDHAPPSWCPVMHDHLQNLHEGLGDSLYALDVGGGQQMVEFFFNSVDSYPELRTLYLYVSKWGTSLNWLNKRKWKALVAKRKHLQRFSLQLKYGVEDPLSLDRVLMDCREALGTHWQVESNSYSTSTTINLVCR